MRWEQEQARTRDFVTQDEAVFVLSFETPAAPQTVWEHLTDPVKRLGWQRHVTEVIPATEGRTEIGSVNHCMHGEDATIEHITDWTPWSYITLHYDTLGVDDWRWAYRIDTLDRGTRLTVLLADPGDDNWERLEEDISGLLAQVVGYLEEMVNEAHATTRA